ncbi:hypothetical protein SAMN05660199_00871 [Klenkia soli]|uniref:GGDEF domain-containing protein, diguanylate cyclase (C-di-GMP synthetase) or its enzymatically inactive variants n=1 Tax=Klenkia soli TaxID=1052260 RepID=A0A1H0EUV3_9ACTN|nr:hypothetical protein [Klenkia soli]SDN86158.1 hypothetical protein SAMN05660199_00871 [Klenkia soli]
MTTLLERPATVELDAITLLPGRAALLDVLALRRPAAGRPADTGVVVVGLLSATVVPLGAALLLDVTAALSGALVEGEWLARYGPAAFAVVTDEPLPAAAGRLLAALDLPAAVGQCPLTHDLDAVAVLQRAAADLVATRSA